MCFPYCFQRALKGPVRWKSHDDLYVDIYTAKKKFFLRKCFLSFYLLIFSSLSSPFPPILTPKCISLAFQLIHWKHNSGCLLFCFGCPKSILILFELTHRDCVLFWWGTNFWWPHSITELKKTDPCPPWLSSTRGHTCDPTSVIWCSFLGPDCLANDIGIGKSGIHALQGWCAFLTIQLYSDCQSS